MKWNTWIKSFFKIENEKNVKKEKNWLNKKRLLNSWVPLNVVGHEVMTL